MKLKSYFASLGLMLVLGFIFGAADASAQVCDQSANTEITGRAVDLNTNSPIANATVTAFGPNGEQVDTTTSWFGFFSFSGLAVCTDYAIFVKRWRNSSYTATYVTTPETPMPLTPGITQPISTGDNYANNKFSVTLYVD